MKSLDLGSGRRAVTLHLANRPAPVALRLSSAASDRVLTLPGFSSVRARGPAVEDVQDEMGLPRVLLVAGIVLGALLLLGGGFWGWSSWRHRVAIQTVTAAEMSADESGLLDAIRAGRSDLFDAYSALGIVVREAKGAIEAAILSGQPVMLEAVLKAGAKLQDEPSRDALLSWVVQHDQAEMLAQLLTAGADPASPDFGGPVSLVDLAVEAPAPGVLRWLVDNQPAPAVDPVDPLEFKLARADSAELIPAAATRWKLDFVTARDPAENSALHVALAAGKAETVKALLALHADVLAANAEGVTPLAIAMSSGSDEVLASLLVAGEKPAAQAILDGGNLVQLFEAPHPKSLAALLDSGLLPPDGVPEGINLLGTAVNANQPEVVTVLLAHRASPDANLTINGVTGVTPLMLAALRDQPEIVEALIAAGASRTARASNGLTVAAAAERSGNAQIIAAVKGATGT